MSGLLYLCETIMEEMNSHKRHQGVLWFMTLAALFTILLGICPSICVVAEARVAQAHSCCHQPVSADTQKGTGSSHPLCSQEDHSFLTQAPHSVTQDISHVFLAVLSITPSMVSLSVAAPLDFSKGPPILSEDHPLYILQKTFLI